MVMAPADLFLLYFNERGQTMISEGGGCDWSTLGDRLMGKLLPGCLADTVLPQHMGKHRFEIFLNKGYV